MDRILLVCFGGFLAGIGLQSVVSIDIYATTALILGAVVLAFVGFRGSFQKTLLVSIAVLACVVGIVRVHIAQDVFDRALVLAEEGSIERAATVTAEPDVREEQSILTLVLDRTSGEPYPITVRARVSHYPAIDYGERVTIRGTVRIPRAFETDTGRMFDYRGYLMKDGVHYELTYATVTSLGENIGNPVVRVLLAVKNDWLKAVSRTIPEPSASFLGGVIVGAKRSLGDEWLDAFRTTGIVHIVVLSGYNLTLVALFIVWLMRPFPRMVRFGGGVLGIIAFALMTGAGATVLRASIMAVLGMLALFLARPYAIMRALIVAAVCMVLTNPFLLMYDPGFQLSFIATIGLILGTPLVEKHLYFIPSALSLRTIIATTLATQCAVLPLLAYQMGTVSVVAPVVNVLVLPILPLIMAVGFGAGVLGMMVGALAIPLAWITHVLTMYIFAVVGTFASLPFATIHLPLMPAWSVVFAYVVLGFYAVRKQKPPTSEHEQAVAY